MSQDTDAAAFLGFENMNHVSAGKAIEHRIFRDEVVPFVVVEKRRKDLRK